MSRREADRRGESEVPRPARESDIVIVGNDAPHEAVETSQLRALFIGTAGLIVVDVLILIYFWTI
ncbi:MAG TPA: hypothetical protein VGX95_12835 [Xanthobacteraceae bacterium]|jgi:hypothetical protein|nr:hypothetical protein [Xanthobacteraceae bacterium]